MPDEISSLITGIYILVPTMALLLDTRLLVVELLLRSEHLTGGSKSALGVAFYSCTEDGNFSDQSISHIVKVHQRLVKPVDTKSLLA
ncbi:hypothetical protein M514_15687, partial [Trichuris suis]